MTDFPTIAADYVLVPDTGVTLELSAGSAVMEWLHFAAGDKEIKMKTA
jgi:hypothetical protein